MMLTDDVRPLSHVAPHEVATVETSISPLAKPQNYLLDALSHVLAIWLSEWRENQPFDPRVERKASGSTVGDPCLSISIRM
ncbi:hypothetical protein ACDY96_30515 [Rhizobium mongolense]|uniref:hypothetical protein n=1 Tax=Rhizobium mongolense TaxID=57676 RepID=UPI00355752EA